MLESNYTEDWPLSGTQKIVDPVQRHNVRLAKSVPIDREAPMSQDITAMRLPFVQSTCISTLPQLSTSSDANSCSIIPNMRTDSTDVPVYVTSHGIDWSRKDMTLPLNAQVTCLF